MVKMKILYFLFAFTLTLSVVQNCKAESFDQRLKKLEKQVTLIEGSQFDAELKDGVKHALSISSDTVKYVGIIAAIILPFLLLTIGYQIIRSSQFEKEIRETRKMMIDEYERMIEIRRESEKLISETRSKMENLENFVGTLATDFLQKATPSLFAEVKEQASQAFAEIKTIEDDLSKNVELMKKLESLDLTLTPTVYLERGNIYLGQRNTVKAIENYNKAIELKPDDHELYFRRGLAYQNSGKIEEAIPDYEKSIKLNPKHSFSYASAGVCYRVTGNFTKSLQYLEEAIKLNPSSEYSLLNRGKTYYELGQKELSVSDFEAAVKIRPKSATPLSEIANFYGLNGNYDKAREYYSRALEREQNYANKVNLSEICSCIKDYANAEKLANAAYLDAASSREKIMSKYVLVTALILGGKDYEVELKSLVQMVKEAVDFEVGGWTFDEMINCLSDISVQEAKRNLVKKMILLLRKEISPDGFYTA